MDDGYQAAQARWEARAALLPPDADQFDDPAYLASLEADAAGRQGRDDIAHTSRQPDRRRLRVRRGADLAAAPPRRYIVKGLMSPGEMSVWVGQPKCGKSFLMLHVAYAIAQGRSVFGKRVRSGPVLYVAAEGEAGISARVKALQQAYGDNADFFVIAQPADLLHATGHLAELIEHAKEIGASLIVIDTLSRVLAGGDENAPTDMGGFIANVAEIREKTGAHVAVVHHGTKDSKGTNPRGHSSLVGAADAVIEVTKAVDGSRTATVVMAKDDPDGAAMGFALKVVEMGEDDDGDPITTCIAEERDEPAKASGPRLTQTEATARGYLADLIAGEGKPLPVTGGFPDGLRGVAEHRWRDECHSRRLTMSDKPNSHQRAFKRASEGLMGKRLVAARDGWVWLVHSQDPSE